MTKIFMPTINNPYTINVCKSEFLVPKSSINLNNYSNYLKLKCNKTPLNTHCSYIHDNVVVLLKNDNESEAILNIAADKNKINLGKIRDKIDEAVEKLSNYGKNIYAFLIGGLSPDKTDLSKISNDNFNNVAFYFDDNDIPTAIISGIKIDTNPYILKNYNNCTYIYNKDIKKDLNDNMSHDEIVDNLSKYNDIIEFPSIINLKVMSDEELKKRTRCQKFNIL